MAYRMGLVEGPTLLRSVANRSCLHSHSHSHSHSTLLLPVAFHLHVAVLVLLAAAAGAGVVAAHLLAHVADRLGLLPLAAGVRLHAGRLFLSLLGLQSRDRRRVRLP